MACELRRDTLFVALTRPQMFADVTYSFFIINVVVAVELFLIFRSLWVLLPRGSFTSSGWSPRSVNRASSISG